MTRLVCITNIIPCQKYLTSRLKNLTLAKFNRVKLGLLTIYLGKHMSYKERSIWVSLGILIYIWFNYFMSLSSLHFADNLTVEAIYSLLLTVVIQTVILEIVLQIVIAIIDNKNANYSEDERDKLISLHGNRNAYGILSIGIFIAVLYILFPPLSIFFFPGVEMSNSFKVMHLIIAFAVIAEIAKFSTQLFFYRRGF